LKFERTSQFDADVRRLTKKEFELFRRIARDDFSPAADRYAAKPATGWPARLRVKSVQGAPGIFEMTWSFAGPAGRATFELVTVAGELRVRWRRVGGHQILRRA
jgi:hypothetical protein